MPSKDTDAVEKRESGAGVTTERGKRSNLDFVALLGAVVFLTAAYAYTQLNSQDCRCEDAIAAALEKTAEEKRAAAQVLVLDQGLVKDLAEIHALTKQENDPFAMSAVARAAVQGDLGAVRLLLEAGHGLEPSGGNVEQKEAFEDLKQSHVQREKDAAFVEDAKHLIVQNGYVRHLSEINKLERRENDPFAMPAVTRAAIGNDNPGLRALLAAGAAPDTGTEVTALMAAAMAGNEEGVRMLLESNADVNAQDTHKVTALMQASLNGHAGIVDQLMKASADPNLKDKLGSTALHRAASKGFEEVLKALLKAKRTDPRIPAQNRNTPLMVAQAAGHASAVKVIKKYLMIK